MASLSNIEPIVVAAYVEDLGRRRSKPTAKQHLAANGGTLEHAQRLAAHQSPRTTKLYDRMSDQISLDEIERIGI